MNMKILIPISLVALLVMSIQPISAGENVRTNPLPEHKVMEKGEYYNTGYRNFPENSNQAYRDKIDITDDDKNPVYISWSKSYKLGYNTYYIKLEETGLCKYELVDVELKYDNPRTGDSYTETYTYHDCNSKKSDAHMNCHYFQLTEWDDGYDVTVNVGCGFKKRPNGHDR